MAYAVILFPCAGFDPSDDRRAVFGQRDWHHQKRAPPWVFDQANHPPTGLSPLSILDSLALVEGCFAPRHGGFSTVDSERFRCRFYLMLCSLSIAWLGFFVLLPTYAYADFTYRISGVFGPRSSTSSPYTMFLSWPDIRQGTREVREIPTPGSAFRRIVSIRDAPFSVRIITNSFDSTFRGTGISTLLEGSDVNGSGIEGIFSFSASNGVTEGDPILFELDRFSLSVELPIASSSIQGDPSVDPFAFFVDIGPARVNDSIRVQYGGRTEPIDGRFVTVASSQTGRVEEIVLVDDEPPEDPEIVLELVDPVSDLLDEIQRSDQTQRDLTDGGRDVVGVAADGVARLLLRLNGPRELVGEQFDLTLPDQQGVFDLNESGALGPLGDADPSDPTVPVTFIQNPRNPDRAVAYALYRAPLDFVRPSDPSDRQAAERFVPLIIDPGPLGAPITQDITIVRPPVVLVHGLWSNELSWRFFAPLLNDPRFVLNTADYAPFNADRIPFGATDVLRTLFELASTLRSQELREYAFAQFDYVGHSMGGLIARMMTTYNSFTENYNYDAGFIHQLITLNTPHLGSELASILDAERPECKAIPLHS